ncbi:HPr family phosphocarrier protein [Brevibacillus fluminis]|uniref:Phosphocarrier protein HPr n=1 Tax=Brevibacillus fluminis TaxID=511487 RepID=A0A3M8CWI8_9BACL|nr:HPr family phosphocarrier protein [Brevibacillus fluminis]RNB80192.1 HPr family phosphocarrier protein [Brevibacillus fluminis]
MVSQTFTIQNPTGLHARPASLFVQAATSFKSETFVIKGEKRMNGKSIMGLMTLGAAKGDAISLEVTGEDEEQALAELGKILEMVHE